MKLQPKEARNALAKSGFDLVKAARTLKVGEDELSDFIGGSEYRGFIAKQANIDYLKLQELARTEIPRNIAALCNIRDQSESDRERVGAIKALQTILEGYKTDRSESDGVISSEGRPEAIKRLREALRKSKTLTPPN